MMIKVRKAIPNITEKLINRNRRSRPMIFRRTTKDAITPPIIVKNKTVMVKVSATIDWFEAKK